MIVRPPPAHRATTAHLQAVYPFVAEAGLGAEGVYLGRDLFGGAFVYDPWAVYGKQLNGPNMLVLGQLGLGKSAFVKSYLWRQLLFGRHAWVLDPKGEYAALAAACGVAPVRLTPGGGLQLNPLELALPAPRRLELLCAIAGAMLRRPLTAEESAGLELALAAAVQSTTPTLGAIVRALLDPAPAAAATLGMRPGSLARTGRALALRLRWLSHGEHASMFDRPAARSVDLAAPLVVLDLSQLGDELLPIVMLCAAAWLQCAWTAGEPRRRIVVLDEAWRVLGELSIARWLRGAWKLARAYGVQMVAVLHRLSDLTASGPAGSEEVQLAKGLLEDSETRVTFRQSPGELSAVRDLLGLNDTEADVVAQLPRGMALWRVGRRSFIVEHRMSRTERRLADTDVRMTAAPAGPGALR